MTFAEYLSSRHTADEQATELYQLLAQIGSYTEVSLLEEVRSLLDRNVDPTKMTERDIRKFLSFFYVNARNFVRASGQITVQILDASTTVAFSAGEKLLANNGAEFRLTSAGIASQGGSVILSVIQDTQLSYSGVYDQFVQIQADDVDLSSVRVFVAAQEIPRATSPSNGFLPFFFNGVLYIKVFVGTDVANPQGQPYSISYSSCLGANGNVDANSFSAFAVQKNDLAGRPVNYSIFNDPITNGASAPSLGELRDVIRYWLFTRNTLTKPSDYRYWFKTQPEVGDCLVWGDTEEYIMSGFQTVTITGKIKWCPIGPDGSHLDAATRLNLFLRAQSVKDVGYLEWHDFAEIYHFLEIRYYGSNDDAQFVSDALNAINLRYDINTLREVGASLFNPLDVAVLAMELASHPSNPVSIEIVPSYYMQYNTILNQTTLSGSFPSPKMLKRGYTTYVRETLDVNGNVTDSETFTELMTSASTASIVRANGQTVGTHNYDTNTFSINQNVTFDVGHLTVYGECASRSYIDTGAFTNARKLAGVKFTKVTQSF